VLLAGCGASSGDDAQEAAQDFPGATAPDATGSIDEPVAAGGTADGPSFTWSAEIDPTRIPLGDGRISGSPEVGSVYSCQTTFGGRGEAHGGPWIDEENGTWDSTIKLSVLGANSWPQARYIESVEGVERVIEFSDLPTEQVTGNFPISVDDPAYQYDPNPNAIDPKMIELRIPLHPVDAPSPSCVGMGPIGVLRNGVFVYNALDAAGADAAAHEIQDSCNGHPDGAEAYHYHDIPSCLLESTPATGSTLMGFALDGYGIYVERDSRGELPTNADLDACHGHTSSVLWNGAAQEIYHYSATIEYPYTVGCFRGTPVSTPRRA
jgi:YHYH protein